MIILALLFAHTDRPEEPHGAGKLRRLFWRVRYFIHDGVRTTVELLRHGDRLLIFGSVTYFAFDVAALACVFQAFGGGAPRSASSSSPTRSATPAHCCPRRAASAAPRAA